jgi:hypothetical protein
MEFAALRRSTAAVDGVRADDGLRFSDPPPPHGNGTPPCLLSSEFSKSLFCTDVLKALLSKKETSLLCDMCDKSEFFLQFRVVTACTSLFFLTNFVVVQICKRIGDFCEILFR